MGRERQPYRPLGEYIVAIIFAMEFEMSAFRYMLDEEHDTSDLPKELNDPNEYVLGRVGKHNVVLAWLPAQRGKGAAAIVAAHLSRTFEAIQWRFLVGVGRGVRSATHDIRLGDVVIGMPESEHSGVWQYDVGRETNRGFQRKGFLHPPPAYLRNVTAKMRSDHLVQDNKINIFVAQLLGRSSTLRRLYQRPPNESDIRFPDDAPHESGRQFRGQCDSSRAVPREQRAATALSEIHYGLIASGDISVASTDSRKEKISRLQADVLCFETEAAGVLSGYDCLVIRGISDYADSHATRGWQPYAAATAAACAKEIILSIRSQVKSDEVTSEKTTTSPSRMMITDVKRRMLAVQGVVLPEERWLPNLTQPVSGHEFSRN